MLHHHHPSLRFQTRLVTEARAQDCMNIDAVPPHRCEYLGLDPATLVGIDGHRARWAKTCRVESRAPFLAPENRKTIVRDLRSRPEIGDGNGNGNGDGAGTGDGGDGDAIY
jgi:hypothetical protein